ncbi:MAG: hypothetical protein VZS44_07100 [Bacilli bacterium]|nr:hypothetical protein [Bacilli bacterium]
MKKNYEKLINRIDLLKKASVHNFKGLEEELEKFFLILDEKELSVIRCKFGLDDGKLKTDEETAKYLKTTPSKINQIEDLSIRKLRFLLGINGESFKFNSDKIIKDAKQLLKAWQYYDYYYATKMPPTESSVTKYYKKVIEVAESLNNNPKKKTLENK